MDCPNCGTDLYRFAVPVDLRGHLPEGSAHVGVCPRCLHLEPADEGTDDPEFDRISDALPDRREPATAVVLAVGLLSSLAMNRDRIAALLDHAERAGVDPLLAMDRLAADPSLDPEIDLERRRMQLLQLLD